MRMILHVAFPTDVFNAAVKDGSIGAKMKKILDEQKPEAAYFMEDGGLRTAILAVDIANPSQIPTFAEPWFLVFNAAIKFHPAMNAQDLAAAGLDGLGKKWA
jgi:hypothetical protein